MVPPAHAMLASGPQMHPAIPQAQNDLVPLPLHVLQVDTLKYRLLSEPFTLLTLDIAGAVEGALTRLGTLREEVKAAALLAAEASGAPPESSIPEVHQQLPADGTHEGQNTEHSSGCRHSTQPGQPQSATPQEESLVTLSRSTLQRLLLKHKGRRMMPGGALWRGRATARATAGGQLHAVVVWVEAELAPGVVISCAPRQVQAQSHCHAHGKHINAYETENPTGAEASVHEAQGDIPATDGAHLQSQSPYLAPHVWQMVHFIPAPVTVTPGQVI